MHGPRLIFPAGMGIQGREWISHARISAPVCTMSQPDSPPTSDALSSLAASPQPRLTTCGPAPPPHILAAVAVARSAGVPVKHASPSPALFVEPRLSLALVCFANQRAQLIGTVTMHARSPSAAVVVACVAGHHARL